jgi:mitotic spindle assembly checkpoint protein MAD1
MTATGAPGGTPISVTQALSDLRLRHAHLLEEHGATVACLRVREARVIELEHRETELQEGIASAQQQLRLVEEQVVRRETRAALAEREVGFLQALLSSYNAEQEVGIDGETRIDLAKTQQIEELQKLLEKYKESNQQLEKDIDALGGKTSLIGGGKSRQEVSQAIENERAEKLSLQKGLFVTFLLCALLIFHHCRS